MKLRNKKTGQLGNFIINKDYFECVDLDYVPEYRSLAELNAEWEDYEEPKGIKSVGNIGSSVHIELGSKEEAERAVEKLKAWKRLKDKGFRFDGWDENHHCLGVINFSLPNVENSVYDFKQDLDLLFGGGE